MSSDPGISSELIPREIMKLRPFVKSSKLELILSCRNLYNMDKLNKSPYCIIYMKEYDHDEYREIDRTEHINNTLNPTWAESVIVDYNFRITQQIMFEVYDKDGNGTSQFMGRFFTTLGELINYMDVEFVGQIQGYSKRVDYGDFIIVPGVVSGEKQIVDISFCAYNLKRLSWFYKNDPFLVINRLNNDGSYSVIARTNVVDATQNPIWTTIRLRPSSLCHSNLDHVIRIDCCDYHASGRHRLIGSTYTSMRELSYSVLVLTKNPTGNIRGILKIHRIHVV